MVEAGYYIARPAARIDYVFAESLRISGSIDRRQLTFTALAGLAGGAIGWIPVELATHGHSLNDAMTAWDFRLMTVSMALLSGMIGGLINAAELQTLELTHAVKSRFIAGFAVCMVLSIFSNGFWNEIFNAILNSGGWRAGQPGSVVYLIVARVAGWTMMGTMLGAGVGLASFSLANPLRSLTNILKGAAGGWVGGFAGGISFDMFGALSGGGLVPRLAGFALIGLLIGLSIGLVQELTKAAWLAVEAGRLRGRQFRLDAPTVMIGRAEENPVGLFGDSGVMPRHAVIERRGDGYTLKNLAVAAGTFINGQRAESANLREGDRIAMGGYELSFHLRAGAHATPIAARRPSAPSAPVRAQVATPVAVANTAVTVAATRTDGPCLIGGEDQRFALRADGATTQVGRALDNDIVVNDASISRHHAIIEARDGVLMLRDLGSRNGTWAGGQRVTQAPLSDGAAIKFGDVAFIFHA